MLRFIMSLRNLMFDKGWLLKQKQYDLPVISVGNLAVGGTGKTPHTEYLVRLLLEKMDNIAVLSRGYGRKTKGYQVATATSTAETIGDEPLQIKQKFPNITVAVCEKRVVGIDTLIATVKPKVILLDDAFQHRYVKPGLNILLTDYRRPYCNDCVMPWGRLREGKQGAQRANIIIVTKCPKNLSLHQRDTLIQALQPTSKQHVFFTTFAYDTPIDFVTKSAVDMPKSATVLTGIAKPQPLYDYLDAKGVNFSKLAFPDHHAFTQSDVMRINNATQQLPSNGKLITTEKDATRLQELQGLSQQTRQSLIVQPIKVEFLFDETKLFNQLLYDYVDAN